MKKTLFLFLALYFTSMGVAAATDEEGDRWYEVEIIVFSHQEDEGEDGEVWPEVELPATLEHAIVLAPPPEEREAAEAGGAVLPGGLVTPYQMLPGELLKLREFDRRLARAAGFTPLIHAAWRQPAFPRGVSMPVRIEWAPEAPEVISVPEEEALMVPPAMPELEHGHEAVDVPQPGLTGTLTISVNRYLHLDTDLYFRPGQTAPEETETLGFLDMFAGDEAPRIFRMHQSRRMRSNEIHYLDHPRFGLIVQVTPFEYPHKLEEEGEGAAGAAGPLSE